MSVHWDELEPLVEQKDQYQPPQEEILQYALFLGLQFPDDLKYLPIVREGLLAPLPPFWEACETTNRDLLFRNKQTREIVEDNPLDDIYRQKIQEIRRIEGLYGVEPINEESALRESSGVLLTSKLQKSEPRLSNLQNSDGDPRFSLIERHITEESQYSEGSAKGEKEQLSGWKRKHLQRLRGIVTHIEGYFPKKLQLVSEQKTLAAGSQQMQFDATQLRQMFRMRELVALKKTQLSALRQDRETLEGVYYS